MMELEMLVSQRRGPELYVLPLFFKLTPGDLKSSNKWRNVWKKMGGAKCAKQWEQVVKDLKCFNGEEYVQGTSESAYIKKVVERICTLMPPRVSYDCSSIRGQSRLAKEIAAKFERLDANRARMVGLHGVGGLGKTTLCKVMVNHYGPQFCGRSFLIEFPSPGSVGGMSMIISQCKKALGKLTDASDKYLLSEADHFDQVVELMRDRVGRHDVFLAVDNVWESFLEQAKRVLRVSFSANSKVLLTSRSEEVLKDLLKGPVISNAIVAPLPALECEEAFHIFQDYLEQHDLGDWVDIYQMNEVLERCSLSGSYHALALKALAIYVKRVCMRANSKEEIKHQLSCVLKKIRLMNLSEVEKVIRLSYDSLSEPKKRMFLDIAVCIHLAQGRRISVSDRLTVQECISLLYSEFPRNQTTELTNELLLDGLIQIEEGEDGLGLHDLYSELALREIPSSPRFLVGGPGMRKEPMKKLKWKELEIVDLWGNEPGHGLFEKLLQQGVCPKLRVLKAYRQETRTGIRLNSMTSLSALVLREIEFVGNECRNTMPDSGSGSEEETMAQSHLLGPLEQVPGMCDAVQEATLRNSRTSFVRGQGLVDVNSPVIDLNGLVELQYLTVERSRGFEAIVGLDALRKLKSLQVDACRWLKSLNGLSCLVSLEILALIDCESLQNLSDMEEKGGLPSTLKEVCVQRCAALKRMPDVSSLTRLKSLRLDSNAAMEEVGGDYFCCSLTEIGITDCTRLRSCPSLDKCKHLKVLQTDCAHLTCSSAQNCLRNLPTGLQQLSIWEWGRPSFIRKIDVGCLTNLESLSLWNLGALEEVVGLSALRSLWFLTVESCPSLKKLSVGCPSLKRISVVKCQALEEMTWDSEALPSLDVLSVRDCSSVQKGNISAAIRSGCKRLVVR